MFPTSNAASAQTLTSLASARSQLADSGSSTPSRAASSRPSHRLQVQSTPSAAQASLHGQGNLPEAPSTSGAAGTDGEEPVTAGLGAAGSCAAAPDTVGPDAAGPDAVGPHAAGQHAVRPHAVGPHPAGPHAVAPGADIVGGAPGKESWNTAEPDVVHTVADVESVASCSTTKTEIASRLPAARPRLRGLRLPWLTNQAGPRPEQVSYTCTPPYICTPAIHYMGLSGNMASTFHQVRCQICLAEFSSKAAMLTGARP